MATERGFPHTTAIYQAVGGLFSTVDQTRRLSEAAVERLFEELEGLKRNTGLIRNTWRFLSDPGVHGDSGWHCNPYEDRWITIDSDGLLMPCQEFKTTLHTLDIQTLSDSRWRAEKVDLASSCDGCSYHCYIETQHLGVVDAAREISSWVRGMRQVGRVDVEMPSSISMKSDGTPVNLRSRSDQDLSQILTTVLLGIAVLLDAFSSYFIDIG